MQENGIYVVILPRNKLNSGDSKGKRIGKRIASAIDADGGYSWLISSTTSIPNDPFVQSPLVVPCILSNRKYKNRLNALINTNATGYAFIDELTAHTICK